MRVCACVRVYVGVQVHMGVRICVCAHVCMHVRENSEGIAAAYVGHAGCAPALQRDVCRQAESLAEQAMRPDIWYVSREEGIRVPTIHCGFSQGDARGAREEKSEGGAFPRTMGVVGLVDRRN